MPNPKLFWWVVFVLCPWQSVFAAGPQKVAYSSTAVVVSCDQLASEAGVAAIKAGGNAVDGAVATAFVLAVTCPRAGNLGGGGFAVIRTPTGEVITNDHREKAPGAAHKDMFLDELGEHSAKLSLNSLLASGVPGTVAGLLDIHERFGKLPRAKVMDTAIRLAKKGFPISRPLAQELARAAERFKRYPASAAIFTNQGVPYQPGDLLRQPDLASTLTRIRKQGKSGFYTGITADFLVATMKADGGLIDHADLAAYRSKWREPIKGSYRGYEVYSMPPPSSGGILLVQMLNMLEQVEVGQLGFAHSKLLHYMIETQRRAFAGRNFADPDFYEHSVELLVSKDFARGQFLTIDTKRATSSEDVFAKSEPRRIKESTETTHISVIDREGWVVSLTTTLNASYGSKIVVDGAGFLLNNEMDDFASKVGTANLYGLVGRTANQIEPNKRMLSSMTPTIVTKDGQPFMVLGSPGGSVIINAVLQVVLNVIDHQMPLEKAVEAPRIHHQWQPDLLVMEPWGLSPDTIQALQDKGHQKVVTRPSSSAARHLGVVHAIVRLEDGTFKGVADPRRAGAAAGLY